MLEKIKRIPIDFINWNLWVLWFWNILYWFLYFLLEDINFLLSLITLFLAITYWTWLVCRLIYITLIDNFQNTLQNVILNKFIEDKIVSINIKTKAPKELVVKSTKINK